MKRVFFILAVLATVSLTGCRDQKNTTAQENSEVATVEYQCPMKCEGDKTYTDKDTKCPVCGMALVAVEKD